jgi:NADH-quinone oxidoreductase subunit M
MVLALLVGLPLGAALAIVAVGRSRTAARAIAIIGSLATALLAGVAWQQYGESGSRLTFLMPEPTSFVSLALDGLSVPLVALTAMLGVIAVLASWDIERWRTHMALLLILESAVMGVFLAANLLLFYVAWEAVLIPMFFLIGGWGHENRRHAAMKFFVYTFAGSALMLVGIVLLMLWSGTGPVMPEDPRAIATGSERLVFWLLAAGFLVKIPIVPLHTWLPEAHVEAPTAGSIMLAGVLLKMGAYGIARVCMPYTPQAFAEAAPILAALGIIGIIYGAVMALGQSDLKRLVAYSSVAHMGFVVLGLASGSALGLQGAVLGMVSHGLVAGLLFFLVGALYERAHTREITAFGGLGKTMPRWAGVFVFASLASLGLPGLSGFPGEFAAVVAGFQTFGAWTAAVVLGVLLAGAYALRPVRAVVQGETREIGESGPSWVDLSLREWLIVGPLALAIVALGVFPRFVTDIAAATLEVLAAFAGTVG